MFILGYEIDFGFNESFFLINSSVFSEKYTGYAAISNLFYKIKVFYVQNKIKNYIKL